MAVCPREIVMGLVTRDSGYALKVRESSNFLIGQIWTVIIQNASKVFS
jgi:hypothetical protein